MNILIVQKYVQLRDATKTEDIERVVGEGYRKHGGKHPTHPRRIYEATVCPFATSPSGNFAGQLYWSEVICGVVLQGIRLPSLQKSHTFHIADGLFHHSQVV